MESTPTESLYLMRMPELLRISFIGKTIEHILCQDMKAVGFITKESIDEYFKKYTNVSFDDACHCIDTTPKEFFDKHFSEFFKNCYPHGLVPHQIVNKPAAKTTFGGFEITEIPS